MIDISLHIAYLLTQHECVILPDLGAFIVNEKKNVNILRKGYIRPSSYSLSFNSDINHNDGLLANSIAKIENITYKEAFILLKGYIDNIQKHLLLNQSVQIPWVGKIFLSLEKKMIFSPSFHTSCNISNFGLNDFYIPSLTELTESKNRFESYSDDDKPLVPTYVNRNKYIRTVSVVAAMIALFIVSTPLNENFTIDYSQQAGILSFLPQKSLAVEVPPALNLSEENHKEDSLISEIVIVAKVTKRSYYVIIASLPTIELAKKKLAEFQQKGFLQADIISSENKNRIYINKFGDKHEAEIYLQKFRSDYPHLSKAWLLSQRNK